MKKFLIISLLCMVVLPAIAFAADETPVTTREYEMGSQMFTFRAGPVIPAFFYRPFADAGDDRFLAFPEAMHMQVGGYGSIRYQGFLNSVLALGGELGYFFAYDRGNELFTSVPFQAKLTYIPLQGTFEIPLSIGLGFAYNSYSVEENPSFLSLLATAEAGFSWYFNQDWGITLSTGLQLIPEIYLSNHPYTEHTTLAGFMPITLSVSYRNN